MSIASGSRNSCVRIASLPAGLTIPTSITHCRSCGPLAFGMRSPQANACWTGPRQAVEQGQVQVVLYFPPNFTERLQAARESLMQRQGSTEALDEAALPNAEIISNSTNEKSRITELRVDAVLREWRAAVTQTNLRDSHVPLDATMPFTVQAAGRRPRTTAAPRRSGRRSCRLCCSSGR